MSDVAVDRITQAFMQPGSFLVALLLLLPATFRDAVSAAPLPVVPERPWTIAPFVPVRGCHGDARRHYVPEFRATLRHFHVGNDCEPVPVEIKKQKPVDCHGEARLHYVPGAGMIYHRHVGADCTIRIIRRSTVPG